ncbi:MAG: ABC transporter ATP-binding protein [Rubrimonas sp.]|uniref:ABC transporter ATP-binding protein n=1 Tax=Rubrimonas sp. TaxID=2036015 RepID=UPI002FDE482B
MAEIRLEGVSKRFGSVTAVQSLDLVAPDGAFVVLLGPTGAGKTTTLRLIAGLERPDQGRVLIGGRDATHAPPAARDVAMVFQQYSLYPHMTVRENLAFPLRAPVRALPQAEIDRIVTEIAELLRIPHKLDNKATQLSGGEMQRVAIGRALVRRPQVYLMDEPLSSLDAKLRADLRIELKRIQAELGATMLYVTHDQIEAMTMATHVGVLDHGRLAQFGPPREIYEDPDSVTVAARLGQPRINLAPAHLFGPAAWPEGCATLGIRPEALHVGPGAPVSTEGVVRRVERLGDQTRLHLAVDGVELVGLTDPHDRARPGDAVTVGPIDPLFFDAEGRRIRARGVSR